MVGLEAELGGLELMGIALFHHVLLYALPGAADVIAVQVEVHVVHALYVPEVAVDHVVVLVEGVLRHIQPRLAQQRGAEGAGVDHQDLVDAEGPRLRPGEDAVFRKGVGEIDGAVTLAVGVLVIVIRHEEVDAALSVDFLQRVEEAREVAEPVVAVHGLEILAGSMAQALVDALAVAAVFLVYGLDDRGVFCGVSVRDLAGAVLRAVVDDDDLDALAAREQAVEALFHVVLGVVAGHPDGQELHISFLCLVFFVRLLYYSFSAVSSAAAITASMS